MDKEDTTQNNLEIIDNYKEKLRLNGMSDVTIYNKVCRLSPFFKTIEDEPIKDVNRKDVEKCYGQLIEQVNKKKLKPVTYNKYLTEIRFFFNWLVTEDGYILLEERNLLCNLEYLVEKPDTSERHYIDANDVKAMLPHCKCQRDRTLIMLLWNTGARIGELMAVNVGDINLKENEIKVTGKTGTRELPLTTALPDLKLLLNQRNGKLDEPLFTAYDTTKRLTIRAAQQMVTILAKNAGITGKKFNCHAYRHGRMTEGSVAKIILLSF